MSLALRKSGCLEKSLNRAKESISYSQSIADEDKRRVIQSKALYLAGKAAHDVNRFNFEIAIDYLKRASELDRNDWKIRDALEQVQREFAD